MATLLALTPANAAALSPMEVGPGATMKRYADTSYDFLRHEWTAMSTLPRHSVATKGADPEIEFDTVDGPRLRLGGAARISFADWGRAVRLMLDLPAVAVALPEVTTTDQVTQLTASVFAGPAAEVTQGRHTQLRRLLVDRLGSCTGVLTIHGAFDDPEFDAEYHYLSPSKSGSTSSLRSGVPDES